MRSVGRLTAENTGKSDLLRFGGSSNWCLSVIFWWDTSRLPATTPHVNLRNPTHSLWAQPGWAGLSRRGARCGAGEDVKREESNGVETLNIADTVQAVRGRVTRKHTPTPTHCGPNEGFCLQEKLMVMMNYLDQYQHLSRRLVGGNRGGSYHLTFTAFLTKILQ